MSLDTYSALKTTIANYLKRDDLTNNIPDFIRLFEAEMNLNLINMNPPFKGLEATTTGTLASTIALPSGYQGTKAFKITTSGDERTLNYVASARAGKYGTTGRSTGYTINGANLEPLPPPGTAEAYEWDHYIKISALSDVNTTNTILTNHPNLYLYGSLKQAAPFLKNDSRLTTWIGLHDDYMLRLEMANATERTSGSPLQIRSDAAL